MKIEDTSDVARTLQLVVHAKVYVLVGGWNKIKDETVIFQFSTHAFNFDYLLHVSGINYLIHPEDIPLVTLFIKKALDNPLEYRFRIINRSGEIKTVQGLAQLVSAY